MLSTSQLCHASNFLHVHLILEVATITPSHDLHWYQSMCVHGAEARQHGTTVQQASFQHGHCCDLKLVLLYGPSVQMVTNLHSQSVHSFTQMRSDIKLCRQAAVLAVA